jgi:hypothetical protein
VVSLQAVVLPVEENDIDADGRGGLMQQGGDLQQDGHTTGSVICARDRGIPLRGVFIPVRPGTGVPVGAEEDPGSCVGPEPCNDVCKAKILSSVPLMDKRLEGKGVRVPL